MIRRKLELYILSLWLLFFFIIVITFKAPDDWSSLLCPEGWKVLFYENIIPVFSLLFLFYGVFSWFRFSYDLQGTTNIPFEIREIEDINYEHLIFLATYVIPLVSFNFESVRYLIILCFLLIVMGIIYIKTDMFYANPSLALLGFRIYKVTGSFKNNEERKGIIILSKTKIFTGNKVSYIKLDDRIYYAKREIND